MNTYWFVTYQLSVVQTKSYITGNIILVNIHPVLWAAMEPESNRGILATTLLFFAEIPEVVATMSTVRQYFGRSGDEQGPV